MPTETLQIYENNKAEIDSQIATAKAYPRNLTEAKKNMKIEIQSNPDFAKSCGYAVPNSSGKIITGPSIILAKIIAQNLGNMKFGARVVDIDRTHVTSQGICIDLERNISSSIEVKRSIIGSTGRFSDWLITVTGNAANAIALRNAIFAVVQQNITDDMYAFAKKAALGDISTKEKFLKKRKELVDNIKDTLSVTDAEILFALKKESMELLDDKDLSLLNGFATAIKDGDGTIDVIFRGKKPVPDTTGINEREQRLIEMIENADTLQKLQVLKPKLQTIAERTAYDTQFQKLKK